MSGINRLFSLANRRALVTGGSRGIGRALAIGLAEAGADVAVAARGSGAETARDIATLGKTTTAIRMDVSRVEECRRGVEEAARSLRGLDILINNAGVENVRDAFEVEESTWDQIIDTNLKGAFFCAQAAGQIMRERGGGAILNICSLTSEVGIAAAAPYGSSKTGLLGMTRALATEWAKFGIRVNGLEPGYFRTALTEPFYQDDAWQQAMLDKIPLRRFGKLEDLVGAAVFLCSDAAAYITGACLPVDGGYLASI